MCVQSGEITTGEIIQYATRETWLNRFTDFQRPCFGMYGHPIPEKLRIACGWPVGNVKQVLGQCWSPEVSEDGTVEIFVNPMIADPRSIAEVVVHELCHAAVGVQYGHKGPFKRLAKSVGLEGPMRNTYAGRELTERLNALIHRLGPYPHASLNGEIGCVIGEPADEPAKLPRAPEGQPGSHIPPKQRTRMHRVICPDCGYLVRTTGAWIRIGLPTCPCGAVMVSSAFKVPA